MPTQMEQSPLADEQAQWRMNWALMLQRAQSRPEMYIGNQKTAHQTFISQTLGLVFKAKAFRSPGTALIHISPTQYVVQCKAGVLLRSITSAFDWSGKRVLTEGWNRPIEKIRGDGREQRLQGWRRYFGSPTGPTLDSPTYPAVLAHKFAFAYNTSAGYWCQAFESGWPMQEPIVVQKTSPVGFLTVAQLDPKWFTGLPFTEKDVQTLNILPEPNTPVKAIAVWHPQDDLLSQPFQLNAELDQWLTEEENHA